MTKAQANRILRIAAVLTAVFMIFTVFSMNRDTSYAASKPAKVKNVVLSGSTTASLKIKWGAVKNADKYQIAYKRVGTDEFHYYTTTNNNRTFKELRQDTYYFVKVRAKKDGRYGNWSNTKQYKTKVDFKKASNESKIKVIATEDSIIIKIKPLGFSGEATLYRTAPNKYLKADKISGVVSKNVTGSRIADFYMDDSNTFTIDRWTKTGYDRMYDKFYVVYEGGIVKGPVYATTLASEDRITTHDVPSKKGLVDELSEESFTISKDVKSNWTALNINMTELILANETAKGKPIDNSKKSQYTIDVNGKTYYMSESYVDMLDYRVKRYDEMGINVIGVVISFVETEAVCQYPRALKYIDDARWTNGFNTSTDAGRDYFIACMEFLADRYSQVTNGRICNYVIGNEVDYAYDWNEVVPNKSTTGKKLPARGDEKSLRKGEIEVRVSLDDYMEEYGRTLRIANTAVKKYTKDCSVSIGLSKEWAQSIGVQQKKKAERSKKYDSYAPKEMLDWLNYHTKRQGDFDWALTPHNYTIVHGNASAFQTGLTSDKVYITGNPNTTLIITQSNLEVLQLYLNRSANRYNGKVRSVFLTENGCSSGDKPGTQSKKMQKEQAAAIAQYYYRAASLPSVKSIVYYKIQDREAEGATTYKLGLLDTNGKKKLSYNVWKYIDTNRSFEYSEKYLDSISFKKNGKEYSKKKGNIKSYYDVMKTVNSKFDWKKYWDKKALTPVKVK